ncbi:3-dehydroquinate synthase II family protein [Microbacterium sp. No. 7]|uniref:3-dehydroquinate synthase II family protein n=1 Tax=Microbacterium sp. No. 7 TaxID=1714373 RepID=UPI0006D0C354|nr:3-dehydroquinate synthase II family protein [Microbacterium sp. No. 7]ALJ18948.1 3-dehydroquinate synthase [Microbacterium sp. No. 7]
MDDIIVTDKVIPLAPAAAADARFEHFAWLDLRGVRADQRVAYVDAAIHHRVEGIVSDDAELLATLPPTVRRILAVSSPADEIPESGIDLVLTPSGILDEVTVPADADRAVHVVVSDAETLEVACQAVRRVPWTLLTFTDPTKIPLEIVIAAAENSGGRTVTVVSDITDAEIVAIVLEHGSDGLLLAPRSLEEIALLQQVITPQQQHLLLEEFVVEEVEHIGMGERACIDTCSLLEQDEGCLIGSFASGFFLSCSETHPLPYMPTRPFRWNAGAVHSYVLGPDNRTRYVSELRAGHPILAVRTDGSVREVRIGRVKIERRPLISITAATQDGKRVNIIAQDDWHVRLLGPGATVNNVTELTPGDRLLGYVPAESRHVGLPISEYCIER